MEQYELNNGLLIPKIGFGTFQIPSSQTKKAVLDAIKAGYRLIDTAQAYHNEEAVGAAVRECGLKREQLFVTTKLYGASNISSARRMIETSLKRLDIGYLDLLLIHCPAGDNAALWQAMEEYVQKGDIKAIGLSNFYEGDLSEIYHVAKIQPVIDQIECHVYRAGEENRKLFEKYGMKMEAWSPLSCGKSNLFSEPVLREIGGKYGKTNAQIALRYLIQRGILPIVKSTHPERMAENIDVFDFSLSAEDMKQISSLDKGKSVWGMFD